jgi:hypothetical protein
MEAWPLIVGGLLLIGLTVWLVISRRRRHFLLIDSTPAQARLQAVRDRARSMRTVSRIRAAGWHADRQIERLRDDGRQCGPGPGLRRSVSLSRSRRDAG